MARLNVNIDKKINEAGGRLFEFLTEAILTELLPQMKIVWQPKIKWMKIQPDIAIYKGEELLAIVLVGHATIKSSAAMKVNRNIEELFEIKNNKNSKILALSFVWHSPNGWTKGHISRLGEAFDYNFVAFRDSEAIWERSITELVELSVSMKGKTEDKCRALIFESEFHKRFLPFVSDMKDIVLGKIEKNEQLWELVRSVANDIKSEAFSINSRVKVALQPLLWVPENMLVDIFGSTTLKNTPQIEPFVRLGGGRKFNNIVVRSQDIESLTSRIDKNLIINTIKKMHAAEGMSVLIGSLESIDAINRRISRTFEAIRTCTLNNLCNQSINSTDEDFMGRCWPLDICTAWVKIKVDQKFGLLEAQREAIGDTLTDYMWDPIIRFVEGRFNILTNNQLSSICEFFENKLKYIEAITAKELSNAFLTESHKKKKANPLPWFIAEVLSSNSIVFEGFPNVNISFQCPFAKKAGLKGTSGLTIIQFKVNLEKPTLIHVLSAYSSTHKHIEYAAKAQTIKYKWLNGTYKISDKYALVYVLDGKWSKSNVQILQESGAVVVPIHEFPAWIKIEKDKIK